MSVDSFYENMWVIVMCRESPDLASTLTQFIRSTAREEMRMLSCGDYFPCWLVSGTFWPLGSSVSLLITHLLPFLKSTWPGIRRQLTIAFFNLWFPPSLSFWPHRWAPDSWLTSWALAPLLSHCVIGFSFICCPLVAKDTLYPPISTRQPACSLSISTPKIDIESAML